MTQLGANLLGNLLAFLTIILVIEPAIEKRGIKGLPLPVTLAVCFGGTLFMLVFGPLTLF